MGKLTIYIAIFNSYFDITRGYIPSSGGKFWVCTRGISIVVGLLPDLSDLSLEVVCNLQTELTCVSAGADPAGLVKHGINSCYNLLMTISPMVNVYGDV